MPAISLERLQKQIADLIEAFDQPREFRDRFHDLLSFYHRYSHRQQKDAIPKSFMLTYDLPEQVIPQLELGLRRTAKTLPEQALQVVDELWRDTYFEARDFAAFLLGQVPLTYKEAVLSRIKTWLSESLDHAVVKAIITKSTTTIQLDPTPIWEDTIQKLLTDPHPRKQGYGLYALAMAIPTSSTDLFPSFLRWVRPFIQDSPEPLRANLDRVIEALAKRSPSETAYLLKEVLADTDGAGIERRVRGYAGFFDQERATGILTAVKQHAARSELGF